MIPQKQVIQNFLNPLGNHVDDLDEGKSVGIDEIPPKVLKWVKFLIVPVLTKIFNACISEDIYPDSLKLARVTPVFKGGKKKMKQLPIGLFQFSPKLIVFLKNF